MCVQDIAGYAGSVPVAVKTLASTDKEDRMKFLEEVELMKKFTHPNIVSLLGWYIILLDGSHLKILTKSTIEHSYNKPEILGQPVCRKQELFYQTLAHD